MVRECEVCFGKTERRKKLILRKCDVSCEVEMTEINEAMKETAAGLVLSRKVVFSGIIEYLLRNWFGKGFTINEATKGYGLSYNTVKKRLFDLTNAGVLKVTITPRGQLFEFVYQKEEIETLVAELREFEIKLKVQETESLRLGSKAAHAALENRVSEIEETLDSHYKESNEELGEIRKKYAELKDRVDRIQTKLQNAGMWQT